MKDRYASYLATLRRVPDDVILSVASREFDLYSASRCVCGWVLRETLARTLNRPAEEVGTGDYWITEALADRYGGPEVDWLGIFVGVTDSRAPHIERAFAIRVAEAAS